MLMPKFQNKADNGSCGRSKFFFKMTVFFINSKRLQKHVFYSMILIFFCQIVCISENKIKEKMLITLPDYANFIKSFEMTLN